MPDYNLGLFDTPPHKGQIRLSFALVALLVVAFIGCLVVPDLRVREIDAFIPIADTIMLFSDLITATVLYTQASIFRSRALIVLASGYVLTALLLVIHMLTFPDAFAPNGLLGASLNTTAWIAVFWRATPPFAILLYTFLRRAESAAQPGTRLPAARFEIGVTSAVVLAVAITMLATIGHDLLPSVFLNRTDVNYPMLFWMNCGVTALMTLTMATLFWNRRSVLDMWLLVALAGWLAHALLNFPSYARFTVSFYSQFGMLMFSNFVVMIALLAETNRLYARLAVAKALQARERDTRLMSLGAVAASISHEVGQPLAGVVLNANAGLAPSNRSRPDRESIMAQSLWTVLEDANRAFEILKSIRSMFGREPAEVTQVSLNQLVRETELLLKRELAVVKISLSMTLDETLPPVVANKTQIQQVLINLLTNAIESLSAARRSSRRITIRTSALSGRYVMLEVSDTGVGIEPQDAERVFQAFFTTKASGTGLGLSLCRTIVDEHGGRLWVASDKEQGATFHLELPCIGLPAGGVPN